MDRLIHFDNAPPAQPAATAPARPPAMGGLRRSALAGLLVLALAGGGVTGGVAGFLVASHSSIAEPGPAPAPAPTASVQQAVLQPMPASVSAAPANLAGQVFKAVSPSVVQVVVAGRSTRGPMSSGTGSGFVVDTRGHILTNYHVVAGARSVSVHFSTGEARPAEVLGTDSGNDLALLQVDLPEGVPAAPLGDSDQVEVGEIAIAIGSPFGLDQSVTQGIISATHRTWAPSNGRVRRNLLQTDAPINPGNSGGPLLNARGEVIGVTSMIESPIRGNVGVGFAVPINTAKRLVPQLEAGAQLEPVWLGITARAVDPAIARDQGLAVQSGVLVLSVVEGGPADQAGLRGGQSQDDETIPRGGDVIVALNGTPIENLDQLTEALAGRAAGETVTVTIIRNGQRQDVALTLQNWPPEQA